MHCLRKPLSSIQLPSSPSSSLRPCTQSTSTARKSRVDGISPLLALCSTNKTPPRLPIHSSSTSGDAIHRVGGVVSQQRICSFRRRTRSTESLPSSASRQLDIIVMSRTLFYGRHRPCAITSLDKPVAFPGRTNSTPTKAHRVLVAMWSGSNQFYSNQGGSGLYGNMVVWGIRNLLFLYNV